MEDIELWCLGIGEDVRDYVLCDADIDLLPTLYKQNEIRFEYNQANQERSQKSCTIFAAVWMVSDLMDYEFTLDEIKEIDELSYQRGRIRGQGRYVQSAVKLVADWWNEHKAEKIAYYRISKYSTMFTEALKKLYTADWNICPTAEHAKDYRTDAIVDGYDFGTNKNWHSIDIIQKDLVSVKDSYKGRKTYDWKKDCNIYWLRNPVSKMTNYGDWFYIYTKVKEDNLEEVKRLNELKAQINEVMPINSNLWHLTNSEAYRVKLHEANNMMREWLEYINSELKRLS